jgi:hypothetical protein
MEEDRAHVTAPDGHIINRVDIRCFDEKEARRLKRSPLMATPLSFGKPTAS